MSKNQKRKLLGLMISVGLLMGLLAISLSTLQLNQGEVFFSDGTEEAPNDSLDLSDEFDLMLASFQAVMIVLIILLPIFIITGVLLRDEKKLKVTDAIMFILFLLLLLIPFNKDQQFDQTEGPQTPQIEVEQLEEMGEGTAASFTADPKPWMLPLIMIAAAVLVSSIAFLAYKLLSDLIVKKRAPLQDIADYAHTALVQIEEAEIEFNDVIIRCYAEMSQTLQMEMGIERSHAMTTSEFEQELIAWGIPARPVQRLTQLFEQVRYGHRQPLEDGKRTATESLGEIIEYCRELE
jgi:hypothetical protein